MGIRVVALSVLVLVALLLKTTVTPTFAIAGYRPDVLVLVIVAVALLEGPDSGLRLGFLAGLAQDLISGSNALVGVWALVLMLVGFGAGLAKPYMASSRRLGAIAMAGVMGAAATLGYGVLGRIFAIIGATWTQIVVATIAVGLYSAVISPVVLRLTQAVMKQFPSASAG